jgi:melanoma-associated antigen
VEESSPIVRAFYIILDIKANRYFIPVDLRGNLKRLRLPPTAIVTFNAQSTHKQMTVDAYLTLLSRQGYIERQRIGDAAAASKKGGAGSKRGRAPAATQQANAADDGAAFEWRWGNRAHSEVGEMAIAGFAAEFMVERMGLEEEEAEEGGGGGRGAGAARERRDQARKNILEKMVKGFERSAGGNLSEIK